VEGDQREMASEETAGGARKATKSKLFEFLVHGVVRTLSIGTCVCVYVWMCVFVCERERAQLQTQPVLCLSDSAEQCPCEGYFQSSGSRLRSGLLFGTQRRGGEEEANEGAECFRKKARRIKKRKRKAKGSHLVTGGCMRLAACLG